MGSLLAVDAGLRTGLALYGGDGRLCWYRSVHYSSMTSLKRGVSQIIKSVEDIQWLVVEGGGDIVDKWVAAAKRKKISVRIVTAEVWREKLLYLRERRSGAVAKKHADGIARQVITWSQIGRPTSMRHDVAEAILIGLWGVLEVNMLVELPKELNRT